MKEIVRSLNDAGLGQSEKRKRSMILILNSMDVCDYLV